MMKHQQQQQQYASYQNFAIAYNSLYHAAQITLLAEILDLQIYAGARHILGMYKALKNFFIHPFISQIMY